MSAFLTDYNLIPFHLSLLAVLLLGMVETIGYYINISPSQVLQKIAS